MTPYLEQALRVLCYSISLAIYLNFIQPHIVFVIDEVKRGIRNWWTIRHGGLNAEERDLIETGKYILAIKALRERTGASLRDAKDKVDAYKDARVDSVL